MELGLIRKIDIDQEMQQSYLDYAMSVIVSRALPDARDGLKPVQRRILYAMYDMGIRPDTPYKKSARIVGEVLGKYHPHGDVAVYEAMARMAQNFSMRYPLVDGQGNFGSVDGDPPAAMRYTEARLAPIAMDMLNQIDKNTVDYTGNFDDTLKEPVVLPAAMPNMLVNGATGIAVGMATNIPPHNLGEVVDALTMMLENWDRLEDITAQDLMQYVKGPDFPTGGIIIQDPQSEGLIGAYSTGRGRVIVKARVHMEEMVRGRNRIIVTELPYMTNKASLIERIAELVRDGHLEGIADLRDESDRQGMRIVIELSKTADPEKILQQLYHRTPMQTTFGINMLALVNGEPHLLPLKQSLRVFVDHRLVVVKRRSEYELTRARDRAHILEGLRVALKNLDEVITLIRNSPDTETARERLIKRFKLTQIQAQAILDMQLRRLASLERKRIEEEYKEVTALIKDLEGLLHSQKRMRQVVVEELQAIKNAYADRRRTLIVSAEAGMNTLALLHTADLSPSQTVWVSVTEDGRISQTIGSTPPVTTGQNAPHWLLRTNTRHTLYLVSDQGRTAAIPVHSVPESARSPEGVPVQKVSPLTENDSLAAIFSLPPQNGEPLEGFVVTVTRAGMVKKSALGELPGPSAQAFVLARVNEGDSLGWVRLTHGNDALVLATARGMAIRFSEEEVRPMGLVAAGVNGIKLAAGDELVGVEVVPEKGEIMLLASDGTAKRMPLTEFPVQGRYGQGVMAWKMAKGLRLAGMMAGGRDRSGLVHFTRGESQPVTAGAAPQRTRAAQGNRVVKIRSGDLLLELTTSFDALAFWGEAPVEAPAKPAPKSGADGAGTIRAKKDGAAAKKAAGPKKDAAKAVGAKTAKAAPARGAKAAKATTVKAAETKVVKAAPAKAVKDGAAAKAKPAAKAKTAPAAKASAKAAPEAESKPRRGKAAGTAPAEPAKPAGEKAPKAKRAPKLLAATQDALPFDEVHKPAEKKPAAKKADAKKAVSPETPPAEAKPARRKKAGTD